MADEIRTGGTMLGDGDVDVGTGDFIGRDRRTINRNDAGVILQVGSDWQAGYRTGQQGQVMSGFDPYLEAKELRALIQNMRLDSEWMLNRIQVLTWALALQMILIVGLAVYLGGQIDYMQRSIRQSSGFNYSVPGVSGSDAAVQSGQ